MNNVFYTFCIVSVGVILLIAGCNKDTDIPDAAHLDGSFSHIPVDAFVKDAAHQSDDDLTTYFAEHQAFFDLYFQRLMPIPPEIGTPVGAIRALSEDERAADVLRAIDSMYGDFSSYTAEFEEAFQFLQYYFPEKSVPEVYTLFTDFGFFPFIFESGPGQDGIGISLEMFLGQNYPYTYYAGNHPAFSAYLTRSYNGDHLVKKTIEILVDDIMGPPPGDRMLDQMIHNGKRLYILDLLLPNSQDTVIMEFTADQLQWCEQNERDLWAHYLTEDLIYSNEFKRINKFINPSPNVPGLPAEAPGRVANWTGLRIIQSLMRRNSDITLESLLQNNDAQSLLQQSNYRPS